MSRPKANRPRQSQPEKYCNDELVLRKNRRERNVQSDFWQYQQTANEVLPQVPDTLFPTSAPQAQEEPIEAAPRYATTPEQFEVGSDSNQQHHESL